MIIMNRNQAKEILPIIQALADGRTIQFAATDKEWVDLDSDDGGVFLETLINNPQSYRIKPKYRPFKNAKECWQEMKKHQPFGWVKEKYSGRYTLITEVNGLSVKAREGCRFIDGVIHYTFADDTPFGIKIE